MSGSINVPDDPGTYTVALHPVNQNSISLVDLNFDITIGAQIPTTVNGDVVYGGSFGFTVIPEPAMLSALLFAAAGLATRRRR